MLKAAMDELELDYFEAEGEAAFYGPKLDVQVKTALGTEETLSTIQLDFLLPERFDLLEKTGKYASSSSYPPRNCFYNGTFCRLFNRSIQGAFPTWLAPIQATIIPVSLMHMAIMLMKSKNVCK